MLPKRDVKSLVRLGYQHEQRTLQRVYFIWPKVKKMTETLALYMDCTSICLQLQRRYRQNWLLGFPVALYYVAVVASETVCSLGRFSNIKYEKICPVTWGGFGSSFQIVKNCFFKVMDCSKNGSKALHTFSFYLHTLEFAVYMQFFASLIQPKNMRNLIVATCRANLAKSMDILAMFCAHCVY